jgi:hypothetical protein
MNGYEFLRGLPTINIYNRHTLFTATIDGAQHTDHKSMPIVALSCNENFKLISSGNIGFENIVANYRRLIQARKTPVQARKTPVNRLLCPIRRITRTVKRTIEREEKKKNIRSQFS